MTKYLVMFFTFYNTYCIMFLRIAIQIVFSCLCTPSYQLWLPYSMFIMISRNKNVTVLCTNKPYFVELIWKVTPAHTTADEGQSEPPNRPRMIEQQIGKKRAWPAGGGRKGSTGWHGQGWSGKLTLVLKQNSNTIGEIKGWQSSDTVHRGGPSIYLWL